LPFLGLAHRRSVRPRRRRSRPPDAPERTKRTSIPQSGGTPISFVAGTVGESHRDHAIGGRA
jgi:hypothetical protein